MKYEFERKNNEPTSNTRIVSSPKNPLGTITPQFIEGSIEEKKSGQSYEKLDTTG